MITAKLTLSVPKQLIVEAKRLATDRKTSVSAMFARFLTALRRAESRAETPLGPITSEAAGLVRLPPHKSSRRLLEDALAEKYRRR